MIRNFKIYAIQKRTDGAAIQVTIQRKINNGYSYSVLCIADILLLENGPFIKEFNEDYIHYPLFTNKSWVLIYCNPEIGKTLTPLHERLRKQMMWPDD